MTTREILEIVLGFLCGGLAGTVLQLEAIKTEILEHKELPWRARTRMARYFGWERLAKSCADVEKSDRAVFATILIGTLKDLGGPLLLAPRSREAFEGMLAEAERRYAETCRRRRS
jgi:hypothetical protein